ncbi:MAG TPA: DUF6531 domain-containing protein, partial [Thermoanaerobaculia bacterium]|nr:DUF6531 domain-containing protein [Thermoanaerobaculia bacterium]
MRDAKGRFVDEQILHTWGSDAPALASNGPFELLDKVLPTGNRQVQLIAEARYYSATNECISQNAVGFGFIDCDSCDVMVGDPVSVVDGNMRYIDTDPLPPILDHALTRTFDSGHGVDGFFGIGWTTIFDQVINYSSVDGGSLVHFNTPQNETLAFEGGGSQIWPPNVTAPSSFYMDEETGAYIYRPAGGRYATLFDPSGGFFVGLRDVFTGRELQVTRETDLGGETILALVVVDSWTGTTWRMSVEDNLVQSIDSSDGITWTYDYSDSKLTSVDGPDGPWRTYTYGTGGITQAKDAVGNVIETHQYDSAGRAITSVGPSDEIANIQYDLPVPGEPRSSRTRVTTAGGAVIEMLVKPVGGAHRTVEREGGCSSCGVRDEVRALDDKGRVIRRQDASGYITKNDYTDQNLTETTTSMRPSGCNPELAVDRCRMDSEELGEAGLASTDASVTTNFAYDDEDWPDKVTSITTASVRQSGQTRKGEMTYDDDTGQVLSSSVRGWTAYPVAQVETHTTATPLYNGTEPAAFAPGGSFTWTGVAQPTLPKHVDGPRTDVSDVTSYVYYPNEGSVPAAARGRLAAVRNGAGHITRYENYDRFGNARRIVDANGVVMESTTDDIGRVLTTTVKGVSGCATAADPLCSQGLIASRVYDDLGPVMTETQPGGGLTVFTYDGRGRLETLSRGPAANDLRERIETTYDSDSGKKSLEKYLARESNWVEKKRESYAYDDEGRLETLTYPGGASVAYTYDFAGRVKTVRDERHNTPNTTHSYDPAGRLSNVDQKLSTAAGGWISTTYAYDKHGNLTRVTDPNGNETDYRFDDFGRMLRQESPVSDVTTYAYNAAGNLLLTTDGNAATTTRGYDEIGRVLTASSTRGGDTETVSWDYDEGTLGIGRLASMTDPTGVTEYSYDRRGLLLRENRTIDGESFETKFQYDEDGNRSRIVNPGGRVIDYTFDYAGRPYSAVSGATSIVTSASYLPFGPLKQVVFGNGTTRAMTFDSRYRPSTNVLTGPSGALASYAYAPDPAGNILSLHDELNHGYDRNFAYDDLNRLTEANSGTALWGTGTYSYDAMGNLLSSQLGSKTASFSYDGSLPKLLSVTENGQPRTVTYDAAGNEATAGTTTSTYSPRNFLANSELTYDYDGRGVRTVTSHPSHYLATLTISPTTFYTNHTTTGTVTLGAPAPEGGVIVELTSSHPGIVVPATVSIGEGSTTAIFGITHTGTLAPGVATITTKHGFTRTASLTIAGAPTITSLTLNPTTVVGGQTAEGTVVLGGPAPASDALIYIDVEGNGASVPPTITIDEGLTTGSFDVTTTAVASPSDVTISASYGDTVSAELTVTTASLASVELDPASIMGGRTTVGRVTLNGPAPTGGATVTLSSSASQATVPASVTLAAGQTTKTFNITTSVVSSTTTATISASYVETLSATLTVTPCVLEVAPLPTYGTETVWIEDEIPPGATFYGVTTWTTSQKASGSQSLTRSIVAGDSVIGVVNATATLPVTWNEELVFYVLTNECAQPQKFVAQWVATDGSWGGGSWGQTTNGHAYMGAMPAPGVWTRVTVPVNAVGLAGKSIKSFFLISTNGQVWGDRIGKAGEGCFVSTASAPGIPAGDRLWLEDDLPTGAQIFPEQVWDTTQKASGTRSMTRPIVSGTTSVTFSNATATLTPVDGETLVFYALLHECMTPQSLRARMITTDGFITGYSWGLNASGGPGDGPLGAAGVWTRYEVPAAQLGLEYRAIRTIDFTIDAGQVWIDHVGAGAASCYPATAPPPTLGSETVWVDDALPAGASGAPQWDPGQKASGSYSMTHPPTTGLNFYGFGGATTLLPVGWGENLGFYILLSECRTPSKIVAQWVASDGSWNGASWGQTEAGHVYMGALPAAGEWTWVEVPASQLLLEGTSLKGFTAYVYGGQAWVDRLGKTGTACFPATATAPVLGDETVWVEDALPTGATAFGTTHWDTVQKASGTQALTRTARPGESIIGIQNATATTPVAVGDDLVFYVLLNECATPTKLMAQWVATDGSSGGVSWGQTTSGYVYAGAIPASGVWTRIEIPAALLNLESKSIKGFYFFVYNGQAWVDRIGT